MGGETDLFMAFGQSAQWGREANEILWGVGCCANSMYFSCLYIQIYSRSDVLYAYISQSISSRDLLFHLERATYRKTLIPLGILNSNDPFELELCD